METLHEMSNPVSGEKKKEKNIINLLSPAFSKKSGGTLFLVFRGAWCVARGAWCVVRGSEFLVGTLSP